MAPARNVTPVAAVALGAAAGAVGTAAMDLVWCCHYRKSGRQQGLLAWETAERVDKWERAFRGDAGIQRAA